MLEISESSIEVIREIKQAQMDNSINEQLCYLACHENSGMFNSKKIQANS